MPRPVNVFAGPYVDRVAHLRKDVAWIAASLADPGTLLVPVWQSRSLLRHGPAGCEAAFLAAGAVDRSALRDPVLLGQFGSHACFAVEFERPEAVIERFGRDEVRFEDLRVAAAQLEARQAGVLAYARAMLHWRARHRHCGVCGAPTASTSGGHVMTCTRESCRTEHFPRLDPAIIVLVSDGERALLGRQAGWPEGRYSTIAGFVEPGESLEDAVAREVLEETGIVVEDADYHSSQPWPFPSSLMIGFTATARPGQTPAARDELEDARWFTREEVASGAVGLPPPQSVSYALVEHWFDAGAPQRLRETAGVRLWTAPRR